MNVIPYELRAKVYKTALDLYGKDMQMTVAIEELSECQKEICKIIRGKGNLKNLAEEIADATIMLEQLRIIFQIDDDVCMAMDTKITRLDNRVFEGFLRLRGDGSTCR